MLEPKAYPTPPFPVQRQVVPGSSKHMQSEPYYGEDTYLGSNRLQGKVALITGADSESVVPWRSPLRARVQMLP